MLRIHYARNREKSAQKKGVGIHYVMGVYYVFYGIFRNRTRAKSLIGIIIIITCTVWLGSGHMLRVIQYQCRGP